MNYRPTPPGLIISNSPIHGVGVFTTMAIDKGAVFASKPTHMEFHGEILRLNYGGIINCSNKPNCTFIKSDGFFYLKTIQDIPASTEITVDYAVEMCGKEYDLRDFQKK